MIYRLFLVAIIAITILGLSAMFYDYYIDIKNAEAQIMAKNVVNCLAPGGVFDLAKVQGHEKDFMESVCKIDNLDRFYVKVNVSFSGNQAVLLQYGDYGAVWTKELYKKSTLTKQIEKYEPGQFNWNYTINLLKEGKSIKSNMNLEILAGSEL